MLHEIDGVSWRFDVIILLCTVYAVNNADCVYVATLQIVCWICNPLEKNKETMESLQQYYEIKKYRESSSTNNHQIALQQSSQIPLWRSFERLARSTLRPYPSMIWIQRFPPLAWRKHQQSQRKMHQLSLGRIRWFHKPWASPVVTMVIWILPSGILT